MAHMRDRSRQGVIPGTQFPGGSSMLVYANPTSGSIAKYDLVYMTGQSSSTSGLVSVKKAAASSVAAYAGRIFVALGAGAVGDQIMIVPWCVLYNVNTNSGNVGDPVYLNESTAGGWSLSSATLAVRVGEILVKSATVGVILLAPNAYGGQNVNLPAVNTDLLTAFTAGGTIGTGSPFAFILPINTASGASTAAAGTTTADAGVLPAATAPFYPTTAADDTKGVRIHASDKITNRTIFIGNGVSNKILNVYAPAGGAINGAAADAAFPSVSGKGVIIRCLSSGSNTWSAW